MRHSGARSSAAWVVAALVAVAAAAMAVSAAGAARAGSGTIVVRLTTEPAPPGVDWSYSGVGETFRLGTSGTAKTLSGLDDGTYRLVESPTTPGRPQTLTALTCSDPSGDTRVDRSSATATIVLGSAETVTCTFAHRALGPRPAASAVRLAARFAPVLRFADSERYRPLRLEDYLAKSVLHRGSPPRGPTAQAQPTLFTLPATPGATYLDVRNAEPYSHAERYSSIERGIESAHPRPTVYYHLAYQPGAGRIAVEYWLAYLYNDFYDKHEGDWEGVTVFLRNDTPLGAAYSQHQGRKWLPWSGLAKNGRHPVVYVARGSHAEYPKAGRYSVRVCRTFRTRRCTPSPRVDTADGRGPALAPQAYDLQPFGGAGFSGSWGSGNYVLGVGLTRDRITDPRGRAEYTNPFAIVPQ